MSVEIFKNITLQGCGEEEATASADVVSSQIAILLVLFQTHEQIISKPPALDGKEKKSLLF